MYYLVEIGTTYSLIRTEKEEFYTGQEVIQITIDKEVIESNLSSNEAIEKLKELRNGKR